jgi:hypothetical protein
MKRYDLESFVTHFYTLIGSVVEQTGYKSIEVLLPESYKEHFGGKDDLKLVFEGDVARENPESELMTFGSPVLDTIIELSKEMGKISHLYITNLNITTGRTFEKVSRHLNLKGLHIKEVKEVEERVFLYHHILFRFRISFITDEKEEEFSEIAVDLHTGDINQGLSERFNSLFTSEEPETHIPELRTNVTLWDAYLKASRDLASRIEPKIKTRNDDLARIVEKEKAQIIRHYDDMVRELEALKERKGANLERIKNKIRATLIEKERRIKDIENKYKLMTQVKPIGALIISYPKPTSILYVRSREGERVLIAAWDTIAQTCFSSFPT